MHTGSGFFDSQMNRLNMITARSAKRSILQSKTEPVRIRTHLTPPQAAFEGAQRPNLPCKGRGTASRSGVVEGFPPAAITPSLSCIGPRSAHPRPPVFGKRADVPPPPALCNQLKPDPARLPARSPKELQSITKDYETYHGNAGKSADSASFPGVWAVLSHQKQEKTGEKI